MGVVPEPWRFDAEAAEYELPAAELEALTAQVEPLLAAREACLLRRSFHAAALDLHKLARLGVEVDSRRRAWTLKRRPRTHFKRPKRPRLDGRAIRAGIAASPAG